MVGQLRNRMLQKHINDEQHQIYIFNNNKNKKIKPVTYTTNGGIDQKHKSIRTKLKIIERHEHPEQWKGKATENNNCTLSYV